MTNHGKYIANRIFACAPIDYRFLYRCNSIDDINKSLDEMASERLGRYL